MVARVGRVVLFDLSDPALCIYKSARSSTGSLCAILTVYFACIGLRYAQYNGFHALGSEWRKFTFRLDNLALGVMLAWIRAYQPGIFHWFRRKNAWLWGMAALLFASIVWFYESNIPVFCLAVTGPSFLTFVVWPSWVGAACTAIVLAFAVKDFQLNQWLVFPVTFVSATSYSVYLIHLIVFDWMWRSGAIGAGFQPMAIAIALTFGLSFGTYLLLEKPLMVLRDILSPRQTQSGLGLSLNSSNTSAELSPPSHVHAAVASPPNSNELTVPVRSQSPHEQSSSQAA